MNDTAITFSGWVGSDVTMDQVGNVPVCTFRVGTTPRVRRRSGEWVDGETVWQTVKAWRALALNIADSVHKGDAVVVHGKLVADVWHKDDGSISTKYIVVASAIGHDLNRGTSVFAKASRSVVEEPTGTDETRRFIHEQDEAHVRLDSDGQEVAA
jgi:single-strand DNA-binding protein